MRYLIVAIVSILAIAVSVWELHGARDGVVVTPVQVRTTPVTIFTKAEAGPAPVIVIAHGFAGSQQLMQPFALTLARNGYVVLTFDFMGHGRNPAPLPGGIIDQEASLRALLGELDEIIAFARAAPGGNGRLALLGHSMASDIVIRAAQKHSDIAATIAVSVFSPVATAASPANLLVIDGALEPSFLKDEGKRLVGMASNGPVEERVTYGDIAKGTARRLVFAEGVEHIGVLYSRDSMAAALEWMNQVFGRKVDGFVDARGRWLGLLFLGLVMLAWPLSKLLPVVTQIQRDPALQWRRLAVIGIIPAVLTPLLLWKIPAHFLPLLLGDYLVLHFALYGILTAIAFKLIAPRVPEPPASHTSYGGLLVATLACVAYGVFAFGVPVDLYASNLILIPARVPLMLAMLGGTLIYCLADAFMIHQIAMPRGAAAFTKFCFLASLAFAIALNTERLFFLIIIVPAILLLFLIYGLFSHWAFRRTNNPVPGALMAALALAWAMAATFPVVSP